MLPRISVSVLSESRFFRETVAARLTRESELEVLTGAGSVHELLRHLEGRLVEVLLVHTSLESIMGADVVWEIRTLLPATRVVVLGFRDSDAEITRWIEAGATAYLEQDAPFERLIETIHGTVHGEATCSREVLLNVVNRLLALRSAPPRTAGDAQPLGTLSDRETEVAQLLREGMRNKEIAKRLGVRPSTVQSHVHAVLKKLNLRRRWDLLGEHGNRWAEG